MYFSGTKAVLPIHISSATAMAVSVPDVLAGFGLAVLGFFLHFFYVWVPCEILNLVDHLQSLL